MNPRLADIAESVTLRVADRARALEQSGQPVVKLQTGDPDFRTPSAVVAAAYQSMQAGETHYCATRGLLELREAVANRLQSANQLCYDPGLEVLVTHGGVHAIYCAVNALLAPGDEAVILDPSWMPYVSATIAAGGVPVRVSSTWENNFKPTISQITACLTERTRLVILNTPGNPTGQIWSAGELGELADVLVDRNIMAISDEVYESLVFDGRRHVSLATLPGMRERTITVGSLSKTYAMTGWRVGYLAAEAAIVSQALKLSQYSITNVAPFIQRAAVVALTDASVSRFVEESRRVYSARRDLLVGELRRIPHIRVMEPQGAFYVMIDISTVAGDSIDFATRLLDQERLCLVPGVGFGKSAEGTLRMTFAAGEADLLEGVRRLKRMVLRELGRQDSRVA